MASFRSILPIWRQAGLKGSPMPHHKVRFRPMSPAVLASTSQELMLDHLIDVAVDRMPSAAARRCR